jgi:hypothetical protein
MPRFENPPVIEAWLEFSFQPSDKKKAWDLEKLKEFEALYAEELPQREQIEEMKLQVKVTSPGELPKVVDQIAEL